MLGVFTQKGFIPMAEPAVDPNTEDDTPPSDPKDLKEPKDKKPPKDKKRAA